MRKLRYYAIWLVALAILPLVFEVAHASNCRRRVVKKKVVRKRNNNRNRAKVVFLGIPVYASYSLPSVPPCYAPPAKSVTRNQPKLRAPAPPDYGRNYEGPLPGYDERRDGPPARYQAPPPYPSSRYNTSDNKMDQILGLVQRFDQRLTALESRQSTPPTTYGPAPAPNKEQGPERLKVQPKERPSKAQVGRRVEIENILRTNCAMCHSDALNKEGKTRAEVAGGGFIMFEGDRLVVLDAEDKKLIRDELTGDTMPKRPLPPVSDADKARLIPWLDDPATS